MIQFDLEKEKIEMKNLEMKETRVR